MQEFLLGQKQEKSSDTTFFLILVIFLTAFYFIMTNFFSLVIVKGSSMNNTLIEGDVLLVNHLAKYERGDIIVFSRDDDMLIKRVIAVEGDEIKCEDNILSVKFKGQTNFTVIDEPYIIKGSKPIAPRVIKEGELFVLGDNRPLSNDSSEFGPISKDSVTGVVTKFSIENKELFSKIFSWLFKNNGVKS